MNGFYRTLVGKTMENHFNINTTDTIQFPGQLQKANIGTVIRRLLLAKLVPQTLTTG